MRIETWSMLAGLMVAGPIAGAAGTVGAQDADAPSLEFATDPEPPDWSYAVTGDVLAPVFSAWVVEMEIAPAPYLSVRVSPQLATGGESIGWGLETGVYLWPLANGVEGLYVGPSVGIAAVDGVVVTMLGAEGGWQFVWEGVVLGLGMGVTFVDPLEDAQGAGQLAPRMRLAVGYAWM